MRFTTILALGIVVGLVAVLSLGVRKEARFQAVGSSVASAPRLKAQVPKQNGDEPQPVVQAEPALPKPSPSIKVAPTGEGQFSVETEWRESTQRALDDAAAELKDGLLDYLRSQQPPLEWTPPDPYFRELVAKSLKPEQKKLESGEGFKHRYVGQISLTSAQRADLAHKDRDFRAQNRMAFLARFLAAAVAILAAVTGYLRMDEATKGYYTGWLRLAAVGFVGGAALLLFLIA